ncbi:aspartic proteinase-like protein 1-like [Trifolium pratense]|uniref:Aspartic proteinase-like protein 1-like n=1 Tax=Trifolium pratense TaxID=57577 RepID=A0A2K3M283_TRIPR|nr:aspartic proteinase-like protein 1-like [Trifolium pratense]
MPQLLMLIAENFMTGYRVVFDREKLILGWKKSDCYDIEDHNNVVPTRPDSDNVPPAVAAGLGRYPATDSSRKSNYNSQQSSASPAPLYSRISLLTCIGYLIFCILFCLHDL